MDDFNVEMIDVFDSILNVMEVCHWIKNKRLKKDFVSSSIDDHCYEGIEEQNCPGETNKPFRFFLRSIKFNLNVRNR